MLIKSNNIINNINNLKNDLNNLFKNADIEIANLLKDENINTRTRKLTFKDVICYKFLYAQKHKTQKNIIDEYKYDNDLLCTNTSFYKKEQKIPLKFYENMYDDVLSMYYKYAKKTQYKIIAVDGTYNNTNYNNNKILETSLNMGYFDILNSIPVKIDINKKQNSEIASLIDAILNNKIETDNIIFVCDRGYFSYDLFNILNEKNAKFVIRIKNNSKHIKKNINKLAINVQNIPENTRFINYTFEKESYRTLYNKKTKENEYYKITEKVDCNIATNLDSTYTDEHIRKIYSSRWDIEEYFKLIKSKFKFSIMKEHNKKTFETYKKTAINIKIYSVLERIIEVVCDEIPDNYDKKYIVKINKTEIINGLFKIIPNIIFSNLTHEKLTLFFNTFIHLNYTKKDAHNPRVCKIPFNKWYVKGYHNKYDIEKLFDAFINENNEELNKNLKSKLNNITFEKILI